MATQQIDPSRIERLNDAPEQPGDYVLYWMQAAQRAEHNPALEHGVRRANALGLPVVVGFGLMDDYPEANLRHIRMVVQRGDPAAVALSLGQRAALIVTDRGYLRIQKQWRERVAIEAKCAVDQVEGEVVVPVAVTSDKAEFAARTIRPKINRHLDRHLVQLKPTPVKQSSLNLTLDDWPIDDVDAAVDALKLDRSVPAVSLYRGGSGEAKRVLRRFLETRFGRYKANRNRPETDDVSHMSLYLHFGQISPVELALKIRHAKQGEAADRDAYLEEMIVRRELAVNFVHYTPKYDQYAALPNWAKQTLDAHRRDERPAIYSLEQLERAQTDDPYWNAAMREMTATGYMHNYMRMYWGKKLLEWIGSPEEAFETTLYLNNKYFIDGRDCNSFANVAWIFGLHDRPWQERAVFGKVRYMNARGLKRKCDIEGYVKKVNALAAQEGYERAYDGRLF